jgi:predicted GIY-YIG superfamily endonuclease
MAFYLYILKCAEGTLYIGHTDNLDERMRQHDAGKADAYTASRRPLKLLHVEEFESRYEALMMERKLKGWGRAKKLAYIAGDWDAIRALSKGKHARERKL